MVYSPKGTNHNLDLLFGTSLYDLKSDLGETRSVADEHSATVAELRAQMHAWIERRQRETGHPDPLREAIRRSVAFAEAGADVLYPPGPTRPEDIRAIVQAVSPGQYRTWVTQQRNAILQSQKDLAAFQNEAKNGSDADVKAFASKTSAVVKKHLDMVKAAQAKLK